MPIDAQKLGLIVVPSTDGCHTVGRAIVIRHGDGERDAKSSRRKRPDTVVGRQTPQLQWALRALPLGCTSAMGSKVLTFSQPSASVAQATVANHSPHSVRVDHAAAQAPVYVKTGTTLASLQPGDRISIPLGPTTSGDVCEIVLQLVRLRGSPPTAVLPSVEGDAKRRRQEAPAPPPTTVPPPPPPPPPAVQRVSVGVVTSQPTPPQSPVVSEKETEEKATAMTQPLGTPPPPPPVRVEAGTRMSPPPTPLPAVAPATPSPKKRRVVVDVGDSVGVQTSPPPVRQDKSPRKPQHSAGSASPSRSSTPLALADELVLIPRAAGSTLSENSSYDLENAVGCLEGLVAGAPDTAGAVGDAYHTPPPLGTLAGRNALSSSLDADVVGPSATPAVTRTRLSGQVPTPASASDPNSSDRKDGVFGAGAMARRSAALRAAGSGRFGAAAAVESQVVVFDHGDGGLLPSFTSVDASNATKAKAKNITHASK